MKRLLFLAGIITLIITTGCLVSEERRHGHYRGHEHHEVHTAVIVGPPVLVVEPPTIIVR